MIAALYVDPRGPYPRMPDVDAWDEARDARLYTGPHAVVAHPPCGPWGRLRHQYRGNEHDCAPRAVEQVRAFGGMLEHPAGSKLWEPAAQPCKAAVLVHRHCSHCEEDGAPCCRCGYEPLPLPEHAPDSFGGYTIKLDQVEWGHVARKRTWLYLVGVPRDALEAPPYPGRAPTHWVSGRRGMARASDNVPPGIKVCSAQQRRRTPPEFAAYLVRLAHAVRP